MTERQKFYLTMAGVVAFWAGVIALMATWTGCAVPARTRALRAEVRAPIVIQPSSVFDQSISGIFCLSINTDTQVWTNVNVTIGRRCSIQQAGTQKITYPASVDGTNSFDLTITQPDLTKWTEVGSYIWAGTSMVIRVSDIPNGSTFWRII